jgi:RNA polymerase sigma-70 factor (ECF subfamily)
LNIEALWDVPQFVPTMSEKRRRQMKDEASADFKTKLIELIPHLRAFATALCRNRDLAEDLAQEALIKAWRAQGSFEPGSNLKAWSFTILRNEFLSYRRRAWRQGIWNEEVEQSRPEPGGQHWSSELSDIGRALSQLSDEKREALILVSVGGFSYEEAARISNCSVGTVKSRVFRARARLVAMLEQNQTLPQRRPGAEGTGLQQILAHLPGTLSAHAGSSVIESGGERLN